MGKKKGGREPRGCNEENKHLSLDLNWRERKRRWIGSGSFRMIARSWNSKPKGTKREREGEEKVKAVHTMARPTERIRRGRKHGPGTVGAIRTKKRWRCLVWARVWQLPLTGGVLAWEPTSTDRSHGRPVPHSRTLTSAPRPTLPKGPWLYKLQPRPTATTITVIVHEVRAGHAYPVVAFPSNRARTR